MKKLIPLLLSIIVLNSCSKAPVSADKGCIEQDLYQPAKKLLSAADQARAVQLFQQNNIPTANLQFYSYALATPTPAFPNPYESVFATQHFNGLPLFFSNIGFSFLNGVANPFSYPILSSIDLDTKPKININAVRSLFLDAARSVDPSYSTLKDSCLTAQFGYYVVNYGSFSANNIVKAWKVTIKTRSYPALYLKDDDGLSIYFDSGMMPSF